ncbi:MAG: hypothetical protein K0S45_2638 [Nitrospira sp.]|nr:hypothetical protein [Nitrospira sp.]
MARKILAMYVQGTTGRAGHILARQDLLAQWPKGFTHVELTTALSTPDAVVGLTDRAQF